MADSMLMITWGEVARGQETRAIEVFNEALGILGRKQQEGALESFDVALLDPNPVMAGFMTARGTREQITALRADDEFRRNTVAATLCVDRVHHVEGACNEGVAADMAMYQEVVAAAPQRA